MLIPIVHNAYPNLPVVEFEKTTFNMADADAYMASMVFPIPNAIPQLIRAVKQAAYMVLRNESGNGRDGVNNNGIGEQADGAPIGHGMDNRVVATCLEPENGTGRMRRFCCFADYKANVDILVAQLAAVGLYVGGTVSTEYCKMKITKIEDFVLAYYKEWVTGSITAKAPPEYYAEFISMYKQAQELFK